MVSSGEPADLMSSSVRHLYLTVAMFVRENVGSHVDPYLDHYFRLLHIVVKVVLSDAAR